MRPVCNKALHNDSWFWEGKRHVLPDDLPGVVTILRRGSCNHGLGPFNYSWANLWIGSDGPSSERKRAEALSLRSTTRLLVIRTRAQCPAFCQCRLKPPAYLSRATMAASASRIRMTSAPIFAQSRLVIFKPGPPRQRTRPTPSLPLRPCPSLAPRRNMKR